MSHKHSRQKLESDAFKGYVPVSFWHGDKIRGKVKNSRQRYFLALLIPLFFYFSFGYYHLTHFNTADEVLWFAPNGGNDRIHAYWSAINRQKWKATRVNDKPGITLAYVAGIGMLFEKDPPEKLQQIVDGHYRVTDTVKYEKAILFYRLPILILNGLFSILFFWYLRRIARSGWLALLGASLILLSPILIGVSQIINPDSLLWTFSFASFLAFLEFLQLRKIGDAIMASFFLGLALLSKYTADIFFPFFFLLSIAYIFLYFPDWQDREKLKKLIKTLLLAFPLIVAGALLVFAIFLPASFFEPSALFEKTVFYKSMDKYFLVMFGISFLILADVFFMKSKCVNWLIGKIQPWKNHISGAAYILLAGLFLLGLLNWTSGTNFLDIKNLAFDTGRNRDFRIQDFNDRVFLEIRPLLYSVTPLVLFSMLFAWIRSIFKKCKYDLLILSISLFLLAFYAALLRSKLLTHIRYEIVLYPMASFLAAIGIYEFFELPFAAKIKKYLIFGAVILVSLYSLWQIKPFYFNYTSDLLPKSQNIAGAWGYGGYEAAQFLNALPNARNLVVWSDYDGFCTFFVGRCLENKDLKNKWSDLKSKDTPIDYYVRTRRGDIRFNLEWDRIADEVLFEKNPAWQMLINERPRNYIKILKAINPAPSLKY